MEKIADAILVLGHRLNEDCSPTEDLKQRIDRTVAYWKETGISPVMPCGGYTRGRTRSEADVMLEMLLERGMPREVIHLENESRTTGENIRNAVRLLGEGKKVALVTSDYHIEAALEECRHYGLDAFGVPAETPDPVYREQQYRICKTFMIMHKVTAMEAKELGISMDELRERSFAKRQDEMRTAREKGLSEAEVMRLAFAELGEKAKKYGFELPKLDEDGLAKF